MWVIVGNTRTRVGHSRQHDEVEAKELRTKETDDRGRIYLGTEYVNKRVTVAIVEIDSIETGEDELAATYRDASGSAPALSEEREGTSEEAWNDLDE